MFTEEELAREEWRPIKGFEGLYEVSDLGRVRSLPRMRKGRGVGLHRAGGRILKPISCGCYLGVQMSNLRITRKYVHRLVAENFLPIVDGKNDINHIDGNKHNNRLSNLEWCTPSENSIHAWRIGLHKVGRIPNKKRVRLYFPNGKIGDYDSIADASRASGIEQSNVSRLCSGHRKIVKGFKAEFIQ